MSTTADWLPEGTIIPKLPNEVALLCLARVPTLYHPVLAAVSKPIRSIVTSSEFSAARSKLNCSEEVLYFLARSDLDTVPEIFALYRNPAARVAQIHPIPVPRLTCVASAAVGPRIYIIGGWTDEDYSEATAAVWVFNCCTHAWSRGPDMIRPRANQTVFASVVNGKVYVVGGLMPTNPAGPFGEVLDPATSEAAWEALPDPPGYATSDLVEVDQSVAIGEKIHVWLDNSDELRLDAAALTWELRPESWDRLYKFENGYAADDSMAYKIRRLRKEEKRRWKVVNAGGRPVVLAGWNDKMSVFGNGVTVDLSKNKRYKSWRTVVKIVEDDGGRWSERVFWSKKIDDLERSPMYHEDWNIYEWNCFSV